MRIGRYSRILSRNIAVIVHHSTFVISECIRTDRISFIIVGKYAEKTLSAYFKYFLSRINECEKSAFAVEENQ